MNLIKKIIIISLILGVAVLLLQQKTIREPALNFINQHIPWSIPVFNYAKDNVSSGTLIGLILYLLFVNIPILPSPPAEAYIIFSFSKGTNIIGILFVSTLVSMLFAAIWYFIGRFYAQRILEKMFKKKVGYSPLLDRLIGPLIFIVYLLPIPFPLPLSTILLLLSGSYKTKFSKVIAAAGMGTLLRLSSVMILYHFYSPLINQYLSRFKLLKIS